MNLKNSWKVLNIGSVLDKNKIQKLAALRWYMVHANQDWSKRLQYWCAVCVCKIIPILQRNKFRPLHLILTQLVRELTDEEKMCDNPNLCKKWTMFKAKLLLLHDKHSTMLFLRSIFKNESHVWKLEVWTWQFLWKRGFDKFQEKKDSKIKMDVGFLFYAKKLLWQQGC
jgi:hypothetical protein